ncbi:hypothetical protein [Saccharicrinis sp. 156]|uniref:hypothetical protein n=1 Tax=Saccharicrinis sp. 156 TaxID=3417574 RepID=UPI003D328D9C
MRFILHILVILLLFTCLACENENEPAMHPESNITGYWINPVYYNNIVTYERSYQLMDHEYGLAIKSDNSLIERKNAGWCGTPPLSYADFEGSWSTKDSTIYITVGYWGGTTEYEWKIMRIKEKLLSIEVINQEHNIDQ